MPHDLAWPNYIFKIYLIVCLFKTIQGAVFITIDIIFYNPYNYIFNEDNYVFKDYGYHLEDALCNFVASAIIN